MHDRTPQPPMPPVVCLNCRSEWVTLSERSRAANKCPKCGHFLSAISNGQMTHDARQLDLPLTGGREVRYHD
jgi:hypothetical protein